MTEEELSRHDSKTLLQLLLSADARCDALTAERDGLLRCVTDNHVALCRAEKAEAEVLALREVIGAVNNEFGSAAWNWPDPWRRVAQLKELSNDRWKRAEAAEAERDRYRKALEDIIADCEADYPPSHGAIKYVALAALKGETPCAPASPRPKVSRWT